MNYDIIGDGYHQESCSYFTIGDLIDALESNRDLVVRFVGTELAPRDLMSWRGSYDLPAIDYGDIGETAGTIAERLSKQIKESHYGYKGGEYTYDFNEEFYVSSHGNSEEFKVLEARAEDGELILFTKVDPY